MNTHISYETAKRLKEFLGESAPEPMENEETYCSHCQQLRPSADYCCHRCGAQTTFPKWKLHDLLSKPFCAEIRLACKWGDNSLSAANRGIEMVHDVLSKAYFDGGLPAVEKALMEMLEDRRME